VKTISFGLAIMMLWCLAATAAAPLVSKVRVNQRVGTKLVDIVYDLTAAGALSVSITVSTKAGVAYDLPVTHVSGSGYGAGVTPGTNRLIVWDTGADRGVGWYSTRMRVKIVADDGSDPPLPPNAEDVASPPEGGVVTLLGESAMPGDLPDTVAYTYCVESGAADAP